MNSKEIIKQTLLHKEPVKIPVDFGETFTIVYMLVLYRNFANI